jgi:phosphoglycolate phosphatase
MAEQTNHNPIKAIIFDFDGTIADSFRVAIEIFEEIMQRPKPLSEKIIAGYRTLSLPEIIKALDVNRWQVPRLVIKGRREMAKRIDKINAFDGMPEALKDLSSNYKLYILSSNDKVAIQSFLDRYGIDCISAVYAGTSLTGKARHLKILRRKEGLLTSECLYVGDETRDIEAAKKAGIKCLAVEWGFSSPGALRSHMPDAMAKKPQDIPGLINTIK